MASYVSGPLFFGSMPVVWNKKMTPGKYNPPLNCLQFILPIDRVNHLMGKIIGKDGVVFKAISHQSGASYIWHDKEKKTLEVWGFNHCIINNAVHRISERIQLILDQEEDRIFNEIVNIGRWGDVEDDEE
jgi:hypothetical protein